MERMKTYVGVDISKLHFDVAIEESGKYHHYRFENERKGFKLFSKLLVKEVSQVVMEASGPYYLKLADYLNEEGIVVSVINPLVIRRFCQMRMTRTKTDKKDAKMIAEYGKTEKPKEWSPEAEYVAELRQLQATSDLLNKNRTSLMRQKESVSVLPFVSKEVLKTIEKSIKECEQHIEELEQRMQEIIRFHHGKMYEQLQSIPGLGKKTALLLIVLTSGFTKFENARQLSSYIGTCPRIFESGSSVKGKSRITKMGMSRIRAMLYMCSWSAKKCNETCKALYDRLVENGKAKRPALIAVVNKLLKQAFAIATQGTLYKSPSI